MTVQYASRSISHERLWHQYDVCFQSFTLVDTVFIFVIRKQQKAYWRTRPYLQEWTDLVHHQQTIQLPSPHSLYVVGHQST